MVEIPITERMKKNAQRKARAMGKIRNSITRGRGNIAGFLGEYVANEIIGGQIENTADYDIVYETPSQRTTYDAKTKRCTSEPLPHYECSVAAYNTKQKCDKYVFVRIENIKGKWGRAWVLGWLGQEEYFDKARYLKAGLKDPSNGWIVRASCYNVPISELRCFRRKK